MPGIKKEDDTSARAASILMLIFENKTVRHETQCCRSTMLSGGVDTVSKVYEKNSSSSTSEK